MFRMQPIAKLLVWMPCLVLALLTPESFGQKPIPTGNDQGTNSQFWEAILKDNLRRVDEYRQHSKSTEEVKDRAAKYIATVYRRSIYSWGADWQQLVDEGLKLLKEDKDLIVLDATTKAISKLGAMEQTEKTLRLRFRTKFKPEAGYSMAWWIDNEVRIVELHKVHRRKAVRTGNPPGKSSPVAKAHIDRLAKRVADWLGEQRDEGTNLRVAYERYRVVKNLLRSSERKRLYDRCLEIDQFDPWLLALVGGNYEEEVAGEFRGRGYINEVSASNLKNFRKHQDNAHRLFLKAFKLHPEFPETAIKLLGSVRIAGGDKSPRYWFDQAIAAEMDNYLAYLELSNALEPKWGGSRQQMIDFALECAATQRYDSDAPYYCLHLFNVLDFPLSPADSKVFLNQPEIYSTIKEVLLGMANEPSRADNETCRISRERCLVELMKFADRAGQFEDIVRIRRELGDSFDPKRFGRITIIKISEAHARESNVGDDVLKAEELLASEADREDVERLRESLNLLQAAKNNCDDPKADLYFAHRIKRTQNELTFQSGETVQLTFTRELAGWLQDKNKWKVVDRHTVLGDCRGGSQNSGLWLSNASHFPTPFVFEAEVKSVNAIGPHFNPGLFVGSQVSSKGKETWVQPNGKERVVDAYGRLIWFSARRKVHGIETPFTLSKSRAINKPMPSLKLEKDTHLLTVVAYKHQIVYYIDGRQGTTVEYGLDESTLGLGSRIIGGRSGQARYRNVTVRKLKSKSPWFGTQDENSFDDEMIENYPHLVDFYSKRAKSLFYKSEYDKAILDLQKHQQLTGKVFSRAALVTIADVLKKQGRYRDAIKVSEYQLQSPSKPIRHFAAVRLCEIRASAPDETIRDGKLALQYAIVADQNEEYSISSTKTAFAVAYAELGDLEKAKRYAEAGLTCDVANVAYCNYVQEQLEKDGKFRFEVKPSQNPDMSLKEILGGELPDVGRGLPEEVAGVGKVGQYQLETAGVSSEIVKDCILRHGAKPGRKLKDQLKKQKEVVLWKGKPTWQAYVPEGYSEDAEPAYGLMVFMNDKAQAGIMPDESFRKVLDEQRMIFVSPNKTGFGTPPFVRQALAADAVRQMKLRYRIENKNVFVGGVGNGGVVACHAMVSHPDLFRGGFPCGKAAKFLSLSHMNLNNLNITKLKNRYYFYAGEKDSGRSSVTAAQRDFDSKKFRNVKLRFSNGAKDSLPTANELERGIRFLKRETN